MNPENKKSWNQSESTYECVYSNLCRKNKKLGLWIDWLQGQSNKQGMISNIQLSNYNRGRLILSHTYSYRSLPLKWVHFIKKKWFCELSHLDKGALIKCNYCYKNRSKPGRWFNSTPLDFRVKNIYLNWIVRIDLWIR